MGRHPPGLPGAPTQLPVNTGPESGANGSKPPRANTPSSSSTSAAPSTSRPTCRMRTNQHLRMSEGSSTKPSLRGSTSVTTARYAVSSHHYSMRCSAMNSRIAPAGRSARKRPRPTGKPGRRHSKMKTPTTMNSSWVSERPDGLSAAWVWLTMLWWECSGIPTGAGWRV